MIRYLFKKHHFLPAFLCSRTNRTPLSDNNEHIHTPHLFTMARQWLKKAWILKHFLGGAHGVYKRTPLSNNNEHIHTPHLFTIAYAGVLLIISIWQLYPEWLLNPQYEYGLFVPVLALYLFYLRYQDRPMPQRPMYELAFNPICLGGLVLTAVLCWLYPSNMDWRMLLWAQALWAVGVSLSLCYAQGGLRYLQHFSFPILFILIAVPWPKSIEKIVIDGLMGVVATVTVEALNLWGIFAHQQGNVIILSEGAVNIAEACSGIRSFQSTLMGSIFLGELFRLSIAHRIVLGVASCCFSFGFNLVRTLALTYVVNAYGHSALADWHDTAGYMIFFVSFGFLFILALWFKKKNDGSSPLPAPSPNRGLPSTKPPETFAKNMLLSSYESQHTHVPPAPAPSPNGGLPLTNPPETFAKNIDFEEDVRRDPRSVQTVREQIDAYRNSKACFFQTSQTVREQIDAHRNSKACFFQTSLMMGLLCVLPLSYGWYAYRAQSMPRQPAWRIDWAQLQAVQLQPLDTALQDILFTTYSEVARWEEESRGWLAYWLTWESAAASQIAGFHNPGQCLPAAGWQLIERASPRLWEKDGVSLTVLGFTFQNAYQTVHVFDIQWGPDGYDYAQKQGLRTYADRLADAIQGYRHAGKVTLEVACEGYASLPIAETAFFEFLDQCVVLSASHPTHQL